MGISKNFGNKKALKWLFAFKKSTNFTNGTNLNDRNTDLQNSHPDKFGTPVFQPSQALHLSLSYQALGKNRSFLADTNYLNLLFGIDSIMTIYPDHIIFFDGVCNLCNSAVQFIIKRDSDYKFFFCPLQSETARTILAASYPSDQNFETILYYEKGVIYSHSMAVLRISAKMGFPFNWLYGLRILPKQLLDAVYRIISRNRYKWFGKKDQCMVPTPELKKKFLVSSL